MSAEQIYLVEMTGANAAGTLTVFRYSTGLGYTTLGTDTPAHTYYAPRVTNPGLYELSCHGGAKTYGLAGVGYGTIELQNADGALDSLIGYGFDGQTCRILIGTQGAAYSTFTAIFRGTMDQPFTGIKSMRVNIRDVLQNLDVPLQTVKYAGTNSLPNGLEGVAADLKGKPKPLLWGYVNDVTPPQPNTSRLIYQLSCERFLDAIFYSEGEPPVEIDRIPWTVSVKDQGEAMTAGSEKNITQFGAGSTDLSFTVDTGTNVVTTGSAHSYTNGDGVSVLSVGGTLPAPLVDTSPYFARSTGGSTLTLHPTKADAVANTNVIDITTAGSGTLTISNNRTALGCWDWCNDSTAGFYFRLGSTPTGQITADVVNPQGGSGFLFNAAGLFNAPLAYAVPSLSRSIGTGYDPVTAPYEKGGLYIDTETTVLKALELPLNSCGFYVAGSTADPSFLGTIILGLIGTRSTTSLTLTEPQIIDLERVPSEDETRGIPCWRVTVNYARRYTTLTRDQLAGSLSEADIAAYAQEWRSVSATDTDVLDQYPNAPEIIRYSVTTDATEAQTEADRVLAQCGVRRDIYKCTVSASLTRGIGLGMRVSLTYPRFSMGSGVLFWILGMTPNYADETTELLLWK